MSTTMIILTVILGSVVFFLMLFVLKSVLSPKKISKIQKDLKAGKYASAIKGAKALISKNPRDSEARYLLGKAYLADKKPELAFI